MVLVRSVVQVVVTEDVASSIALLTRERADEMEFFARTTAFPVSPRPESIVFSLKSTEKFRGTNFFSMQLS